MRKDGTNLVNVDVLFGKYSAEFLKFGIITPALFRLFLQQKLGGKRINKFVRLDSKMEIAGEFTRKLADITSLPQDEFGRLFPFLAAEDVASFAGKALNFATLRNGDIYLPSAIEFDEAEWQREIAKIQKDIAEQGYSFYSQLDLSKTRANCAGLPDEAFGRELEKKLAESSLALRGQIISTAHEKKQLSQVIGSFCNKQDKFTFGEILMAFGEFVPRSYSSWCNSICLKNAIQVDFDNFISFKSLEFDIDATDSCIYKIYGDNIFTVCSFKEYHLLPDLEGYRWNKYLLQSYLLNFSREYIFIAPGFNRQCIGIARHKSIKWNNYHHLAAIMAKKAKIVAEPEKLGAYLVGSGIYATRRPEAISAIMNLMTD